MNNTNHIEIPKRDLLDTDGKCSGRRTCCWSLFLWHITHALRPLTYIGMHTWPDKMTSDQPTSAADRWMTQIVKCINNITTKRGRHNRAVKTPRGITNDSGAIDRYFGRLQQGVNNIRNRILSLTKDWAIDTKMTRCDWLLGPLVVLMAKVIVKFWLRAVPTMRKARSPTRARPRALLAHTLMPASSMKMSPYIDACLVNEDVPSLSYLLSTLLSKLPVLVASAIARNWSVYFWMTMELRCSGASSNFFITISWPRSMVDNVDRPMCNVGMIWQQ